MYIIVLLMLLFDINVTGAKYLDDCPAERYIPIYLVVAGCFGVLRNTITIVRRCCRKDDENEENQTKVNPVESVIDCFMFAWFIAGEFL